MLAIFFFGVDIEHHEEIAAVIQPLLAKPIIARKVESVELKPKDPENPTLHESTVQRLNNQAAMIEALKAEVIDTDTGVLSN